MQPLWTKKPRNLSGQKKIMPPLRTKNYHATSWYKKNHTTSLDNKSHENSWDKKNCASSWGGKITQPLRTKQKLSELLGQKNHGISQQKNHTTSWDKK